jgi:hypothetical protein
MVGISADVIQWIVHLLFIMSRAQPKINLRGLIIKNGDAEVNGMVVHPECSSVSDNTLYFN